MSKRKVVDAKVPLAVYMDKTEAGRPTMTVGRSKLVFRHATGRGKNRVFHFTSLPAMKTKGKQ
jgi:hypothetical protein